MTSDPLRREVTVPRAAGATGARRPSLAHAGAIFLGAFLLFEVQLVSAKALLPRFGGAPAVWTTCMLFYQAILLAGYAYAHAIARRFSARTQAVVHGAVLAAALAQLACVPALGEPAEAAATPVRAILLLLGRSVALPVLALCASSPLLQAWLARERSARAPYRLYALSNAGSLLGLVGYPLFVEPWLTLRVQAIAWAAAFAAFALLTAWCARDLARGAANEPVLAAVPSAGAPAADAAPERRWLWLALPACATTLLLAVTNQMCQEVAVVPLLWVVPLALYLLSFVLCFESARWYARGTCMPILILTLAVLAQAGSLGAHVGIAYAVPVYSVGLFVCCMFLHGELAALRPSAAHLTEFYVRIALGGALGGLFVSLVAPRIFNGFDELYVGLLTCEALAALLAIRDPAYRRPRGGAWHPVVPALVVVVLVIGMALGTRVLVRSRADLREMRNFYGILRVQDLAAPDGAGTVRYLTHGGTRHGQQFLAAERRKTPTTYFGHPSGIGMLLDRKSAGPPLRVGIVGLGAGVLAAYGRAGDVYRFYELNPLVVEVAEREFTFLADCAAAIEVVPGDARLSLAREPDQRYDVLVIDAFSSDAIPVHLLTREAFELYGRHLAPRGILALHVTTRHLDLGPLVEVQARNAGKRAWEIVSAADDAQGLLGARWILLASEAELPGGLLPEAAHALASAHTPRPWTDDYSDLLAVLK